MDDMEKDLKGMGFNLNRIRIHCNICSYFNSYYELVADTPVSTKYGVSINYRCNRCLSVIACHDEILNMKG